MIPIMNEEESIEKLTQQIDTVCAENNIDRQIIYVDDGSTDDSWNVIQKIVGQSDNTQAIKFRRNFGKAAALSAGFQQATGELVITMDADLQDDPQEIPRFLEKIDSGLDVVSGWKKVRHDPWHKVLPSRVFNGLVSWLTGVKLHDHNCGFKCYRRGIFDEIELYGERHRFVPVLAAANGWRVGEIEVTHRPREFGVSKYGVERLVKGFLDLISIYFLTSFGKRPLHIAGAFGLICLGLGGFGLVYLTFQWIYTRMNDVLADNVHLSERALFYYCILAILLGTQLLLSGLLAELVVSNSRPSSPFSISEQLKNSDFESGNE